MDNIIIKNNSLMNAIIKEAEANNTTPSKYVEHLVKSYMRSLYKMRIMSVYDDGTIIREDLYSRQELDVRQKIYAEKFEFCQSGGVLSNGKRLTGFRVLDGASLLADVGEFVRDN